MKHAISFAASLAAVAVAIAPSPAIARKPQAPAVQSPVSFPQSERDYDALFSGRPAVQRVRVPGGLFLSRPVAGEAPQGVLSKMIEIDIRSEVPTLADLQMLLEAQGIPVTIDWRSLAAGADTKGRIDSFNVQSRYGCVTTSANVGTGISGGANGGVGGVGGASTGVGTGGQGGNGQNGSQTPCQPDDLKGSFSDQEGYRDDVGNMPSQNGSAQGAQQAAAQTAAGPSNEGADGAGTALGRQAPAFYDRVLPFRYFRGTVGELMRRLENTGNIAVWYENGIVLGDVRRYSVAALQNRDVIQSMVNELRRLGAKDVLGSVGAGQVFYSSPPRTNNEIIEPYLRRLSGNLSEVTMQVALVTVSMSKAAEAGFDWSKLKIGYGGNVANVTDVATDKPIGLPNGTASLFGSDQFGANLGNIFGLNKILTVAGAIKYLSTMGNTNIAQNVELRTLSGSPVLLRSGEEVPYVDGVGAVAAGGLGGGSQQTAQTSRLGTGLTLNVDPRYDSSSGIVTMDVGIKLVDLVEFVQLNAGQLGTLTQPRTREQAVNSILRVPAGQTTILGGIRRDLSVQSRNGPFGAFGIGSKTRQNEVFWLFAIVRPVVTVYETADAPVAPRSVLDTRTTVNPYDEGSYGAIGVPGPAVLNPGDPQTTTVGGTPTYYGNRGLTPANRSPAGVTVASPPAPRNIVVPNAATQPEVNGYLPSGSVQRDPGAPTLSGRVGVASTPTSPYAVAPVDVSRSPVTSRQPSGATTIEGETNVPQAVNQLQTPSPQPKRSFVRPMTAAEQSGGK